VVDAAPVTLRGLATGRAVIAANRVKPTLTRFVLFAQYSGGDRQVLIWVEELTGVSHPMDVVSDIDLPQTYVDTAIWRCIKGGCELGTGPISGGEPPRLTSDVQCPWPRNLPVSYVCATLLESNGKEHCRRHSGLVGGQLVSRWRECCICCARENDQPTQANERPMRGAY